LRAFGKLNESKLPISAVFCLKKYIKKQILIIHSRFVSPRYEITFYGSYITFGVEVLTVAEAVFGNGFPSSSKRADMMQGATLASTDGEKIGVSGSSVSVSGAYRGIKDTVCSESFFATALRVLYTLTPAILILDADRRIVFANRQAEELLEVGDVISLDKKGKICCTDHVAQNFLLQYLGAGTKNPKSLFEGQEQSFLIPKSDGWPMVAMVGCDQLDALSLVGGRLCAERHVTLMIRDPNGRHPEQSEKLIRHFGLSGAETIVVRKLAEGLSPSDIAAERGVSVVTIRNQLKSAQGKMGVTRQSELVSLVLRYIS